MFNPNSQNQRWSKWVWFVEPGLTKPRPIANVQENCLRFARSASGGFGSAGQMRVREMLRRNRTRGYLIEALAEGLDVHDPLFVEHIRRKWKNFFTNGFGIGTTVRMTAKLMAGSRQDGSPAEQLIILPTISIGG